MIMQRLKDNWQSGLAVALVSIPLSISLAVASGTCPTAGIITAVWAGLVAALFGGSNFNVVGPTGALSGVVASYALVQGMDALALLTILSGCFILLAYFFRLERYLILIPSSVVHGFTLGVACIISLNQLNFALGLQNLPQHEHLRANVWETILHSSDVSLAALLVFVVFLGLLFVLRWLTPKIPGAILVAPLGIAFGYASVIGFVPIHLQTLGEKFSNVTFKFFLMPHIAWYQHVMQTAAVVALIAILETMLSAKIADSMTDTKHDARKEMFGLGVANLASGIMGGIPATAALARTALNIKAHANYKTSAALSAVFIALISLFLLTAFRYIPLAVIAAILIYVSVQMIEAEHFISLFKYERVSFWVSLLVAAVTVYKDPIAGILLGAAIALLLVVNKISQGQCDIKAGSLNEVDDGQDKVKALDKDATIVLYSIKGKLCYINSQAHLTRFETELGKYTYIVLRLKEVYFVDLDGVAALDEMVEMAHERGQIMVFTGIAPCIARSLEQTSVGYQLLKKNGLVFKKTRDALAYIGARKTSAEAPAQIS